MKGVVKSFSRLKGYGFIQSEELEHEVFVHYTNIDDMDGFKTLSINDKVEFNYDKNHKRAVHVTKRKWYKRIELWQKKESLFLIETLM